ncbi:unnamed protein product [Rhizophagus irregularis]|nr:unnamed protein product [Rhizophagus irregularis]CAB5365709.1 unnamed protein product [Rhizophagus irregularis]
MYSWKRGSAQYQEYVSIFHINSTAEEEYNKTDDRIHNLMLGGFGKVYSATWTKGFIIYWDIDNQEYYRSENVKVALKSLDDSFDTNLDLLNEIKSYLHMYTWDIIQYFGITQDPNSKELLSFKNLPEPVNSNDLVSECFDCVIDETA